LKLIPSITPPAWIAGFKVITTKCKKCNRSLALRHLSAHKAGIRMQDAWYCSSLCFTSAAEQEILRLLTSGTVLVNHISRMPLGLILINRGLLTIDQLREATSEQKEGDEIGELLVRLGLLTEKQVTATRATQWGCPVFAVPDHAAPVAINIPLALLQIYLMVPVHYVAATNLLLVGFVHRVEYGLLYAIEQMTGCKTRPCFVTPSDFRVQMQQRQQLQEPLLKEMIFERIQTPAEMARILCSSSIEIEADEASFGKCKEYLWARLKSDSEAVDLLFKTH
jgi:Type II secretion system (T2SS), protein E, N-terminal domain